MGIFNEWVNEHELGYSRTPPNLPSVVNGPIGNELDTDAGRTSRERDGESGEPRFRSSVDKFKTKISETPVPRSQESRKSGLGNLGHSTFDRSPEKAGDNPTLSNGIPVGSMRGQFGENVAQDIAQQQMGEEDFGAAETKIMRVIDQVPPTTLMKVWPNIIQAVQNRITSANAGKGKLLQKGVRNDAIQGMQQWGKAPRPPGGVDPAAGAVPGMV